jgi:hypothetical protein
MKRSGCLVRLYCSIPCCGVRIRSISPKSSMNRCTFLISLNLGLLQWSLHGQSSTSGGRTNRRFESRLCPPPQGTDMFTEPKMSHIYRGYLFKQQHLVSTLLVEAGTVVKLTCESFYLFHWWLEIPLSFWRR